MVEGKADGSIWSPWHVHRTVEVLSPPHNHLYYHNTITGQVEAADIYKHQADELGTTVQNDLFASHPVGIHNTISSYEKPMESMKRKQRR